MMHDAMVLCRNILAHILLITSCVVLLVIAEAQQQEQPVPRGDLVSLPRFEGRSLAAAGAKKQGCKKLLWFTAIGSLHGRASVSQRYADMVKVAVLSARANAPSLKPQLIYDGKESSFTQWYRDHGGTIHHWQLSFMQQLRQSVKRGEHLAGWLNQYGAYMRIDIPLILEAAAHSNSTTDGTSPAAALDPFGPDVERRWVLYTDSDVIFTSDVNTCNIPHPRYASLGPEFQQGTIANSGVMIINVQNFHKQHAALIRHGTRTGWSGVLDQTLLLEFFGKRLTLLPDELNWKPYWGSTASIRVVHFHGLKPGRCLTCLLSGAAVKSCGCAQVYLWIWRDQVRDKGRFYRQCVRRFQEYLDEAKGLNATVNASEREGVLHKHEWAGRKP